MVCRISRGARKLSQTCTLIKKTKKHEFFFFFVMKDNMLSLDRYWIPIIASFSWWKSIRFVVIFNFPPYVSSLSLISQTRCVCPCLTQLGSNLCKQMPGMHTLLLIRCFQGALSVCHSAACMYSPPFIHWIGRNFLLYHVSVCSWSHTLSLFL